MSDSTEHTPPESNDSAVSPTSQSSPTAQAAPEAQESPGSEPPASASTDDPSKAPSTEADSEKQGPLSKTVAGAKELGDAVRIRRSPHLVIVTIVVISAIFGVLLWANNDEYFPLILIVFTAGTLGGLLNTYRRYQLIISDEDDRQVVLLKGEGVLQIYMSPVIGGLFAIILYLLFLSGYLRGHLFPEFTHMEQPFSDLATIFKQSLPQTNSDAIKLLFWAFAAGFSERYAPNLLSNVIRIGQPKK